MRWRATAMLVLSTQLLTGCKFSFDISPLEVPNLQRGRVRTLADDMQTVADKHEVTLVPHDGVVFMTRRADRDLIVAVPVYDEALERARGLQPLRSFAGPIYPGGIADEYITGPPATWTVWRDSVQKITIAQYSPVRTGLLVTGVALGGVAVATVLLVFVAAIVRGSWGVGGGCC
jgi:hypothetical protein